jgi:putative CocE/NonD family hydrolase
MPTSKLLATLLLFVFSSPVFAITQSDDTRADDLANHIKAAYTKYEYEIPMRDGKRLFTAVYVPKDDSRDYAIMLKRTPYSISPYGVDNYPGSLGPSDLFARESFIFVYQDVRGRYMSEGEFIEVTPHKTTKNGADDFDESSDAYDTIEWIVKNIPGNNGRIGMWGISYPGFYVTAGMIDAHPALVAASPQAPVVDLYRGDDTYHNGAFFLAANFGFYTFFEKHQKPTRSNSSASFEWGTQDSYEFFLNLGNLSQADKKYYHRKIPYWTDLVEHSTYDEFGSRAALTGSSATCLPQY